MKFLVLVLVFVLFFANIDANGEGLNVCLNCTKFNNIPPTGTGVDGGPMDKKFIMELKAGEKGNPELATCLQGYKIGGEITNYVCYWSATLGCQGIVGKKTQQENPNDVEYEVCPRCALKCVENKKKKKKKKKSAAVLCSVLSTICLTVSVITSLTMESFFAYF